MLFRQQAIEATQAQTLGSILLARPLSSWIMVAIGAMVLVILALCLYFVSYTRKFVATGVLVPTAGVVRLVSPETGVVQQVFVSEGDTVSAGQSVFLILAARSSQLRGDSQADVLATIRARKASLEQEQVAVAEQLKSRLSSSGEKERSQEAEAALLSRQRELQLKRVAIAKDDYERYVGLVNLEFVGRAQADAKMAALLDQQQKLAELDRSLSTLARDRASAKEELGAFKTQTTKDLAAIERERHALEQQEAEIDARHVPEARAPSDGRISAINVHVGDTVNSGQRLADIVPTGDMQVELYVSPRDVASIRIGQAVRIKYAAYPYQDYGTDTATIEQITETPIEPMQQALSGKPAATASYRVFARLGAIPTARLESVRRTIRPGATLECVVEGETRRLYQWVLFKLTKTSVG